MFTHQAKTSPTKTFSDRRQRFYSFLKEYPVGVLSSVTPNNDPHGVVIYFDVDRNFVLSFITRAGTRKNDNLKHNSHVMLTVFDPKTQAVVQVSGIAVLETDSYEVNGIAGSVLRAGLKTSEYGLPPISKLEAGPFIGYRIIPKQIRMAVYARPDAGDYGELFESIESFDLENFEET